MGFVDGSLLPNEEVVYVARRHWLFTLVRHLKAAIIIVLGITAVVLGAKLATPIQGLLQRLHMQDEHVRMCVRVWRGLSYLIAAGLLLWVLIGHLSYFSYEYVVTNRRVIMKLGFIRRDVFELQRSQIESVGITQTLWGRILSYGSVQLSGTGGRGNVYPHIAAPLRLREAVYQQLSTGIVK